MTMNRRTFSFTLCQTVGGLIATELFCPSALAQGKRANAKQKNSKPSSEARASDPKTVGSALFRDPDGDFTVVFPAEPRYELDRQNFNVTYFAAVKDHVVGVIVGLNSGQTKWTPERIREISAVFDEVVSSRVAAPHILELSARAYAKESKSRYQELMLRSILTRTRYYTLFARAEFDVSLDAALARNFFSSFKLTPAAIARKQQNIQQGNPGQTQPTEVRCINCSGSGKITCYRCQGTGKGDFNDTVWWCRWCYGNGGQKCYSCNGTGKRWT